MKLSLFLALSFLVQEFISNLQIDSVSRTITVTDEQTQIENIIFILTLLLIIFNVLLLFLTLYIFKGMYMSYFKRPEAYFDINWLVVSFWISKSLIWISYHQ